MPEEIRRLQDSSSLDETQRADDADLSTVERVPRNADEYRVLDETSRIRKLGATAPLNTSPNAPSTQEQIRALIQHVSDASLALRDYQQGLRQKGMNLPSGAQESLKLVAGRLGGLTNELTGRQIELRQLRALAQTTALINSTLDLSTVLNQVMDTVIQLTGAERGFILLKNLATGELEFRVARGIDRAQLGEDEFKVSSSVLNQVITTGEAVRTENAGNDPRYEGHASVVLHALRSILAVPLVVSGATGSEIIGAVYCDNRVLVGLFKEHEMNLLRAFADQAAVALQNARLFEAARARLAEISEMRDLMDNIFTSITSGLITLNARGLIAAYNPAAERITGLRAADAISRPLAAVLPAFHDVLTEPMAEVRAKGGTQYVEAEIALDGRGWRYWTVTLSPLRDGAGVAMVLDDLTEERQRELQLGEVRRYLPLALVENLRSQNLLVLGGQECEISVLFADVRGFTSFSERLQPEDLMQIINRYLTVASDAINQYEGVVEKYIGDAVTGLFGTPLNPQPDHALRAVQAAIAMRDAVARLHATLPEDQRLQFGIGVHTGLAVLGNVGTSERQEFAAIGDAVDMSKLLQENAGRGEILLSAATYDGVKAHIEAEALTPKKTKGREDFTVLYRVESSAE